MENIIEKLQAYAENYEKASDELMRYVSSHEDWIYAFFDYTRVREHIVNGDAAILECVDSFDEYNVYFYIGFENSESETVFISAEDLLHISDMISRHKEEYSESYISEKIERKRKELDSLRLEEISKEEELAELQRQLNACRSRKAESEK